MYVHAEASKHHSRVRCAPSRVPPAVVVVVAEVMMMMVVVPAMMVVPSDVSCTVRHLLSHTDS